MRQILVLRADREGLERQVSSVARSDQEQWRQMGLSTQVKYRIRQMLVGEGLERYVGRIARSD